MQIYFNFDLIDANIHMSWLKFIAQDCTGFGTISKFLIQTYS